MTASNPTAYVATRHRGLSYRLKADKTKKYYGYVAGQGRVALQSRTEQEALAELGGLRGKAIRGEVIPSSSLKFGEVAETWWETKSPVLRPWSRKEYRRSLDKVVLPRFATRKIREIQYGDVLSFVRSLEAKGLSRSTVDSHLIVLGGILKFAQKNGQIAANPVALLDKADHRSTRVRETAREWTADEVDAVIKSAEYLATQPESRYDYSLLVRLAFSTGLRLGEVLGLQWGDVDFSTGTLHVRRQWARTGAYAEPKTKAGIRSIPLDPDLVKRLAAANLASRFSDEEHPVFASKAGTPLGHRNVTRRGWEAAVAHAEVEGAPSFHQARHSFASRLIGKNVPITVVAKLLGHEDAKVTLSVYAHVFNAADAHDVIREAVAL